MVIFFGRSIRFSLGAVAVVAATLVTTSVIATASAETVQPSCNEKGGAAQCTITFGKGATEWVVPDGVSHITVDLYGAEGGSTPSKVGSILALGGKGGRATATLGVKPGQVFQVNVGGQGSTWQRGASAGGFNGGGAGADGSGGGGASDIRSLDCGNADPLKCRQLVAGGGGGGGILNGTNGGAGGGEHGGASDAGESESVAAGGTGDRGGAGSIGYGRYYGERGSWGKGGNSSSGGGGGGGGGYYGGGAGNTGGGGGGSGFAVGTATKLTFQTGVRSGDGQVTISYLQKR